MALPNRKDVHRALSFSSHMGGSRLASFTIIDIETLCNPYPTITVELCAGIAPQNAVDKTHECIVIARFLHFELLHIVIRRIIIYSSFGSSGY
jgi:hypothetical protein